MKHLFYTSLLAVIVLAAGCSKPTSGNDAEAIKTQLTTLRAQKNDLDKQIRTLEDQLALLDTTAKESKEFLVEAMPVNPDTFMHFIKVSGRLESNNNIAVNPKMPGTITAIYVQSGQEVRAGQVLGETDGSVIRSSLDELELQLQLATTVYEKQERLWKQKIGSEIQYLQAKNNKEAMEKRISTTREQLEMTKIKSPINGVVDQVMAKVGEAVMPGFGAFRVVSLSDLVFKADVSEKYVPFVKKGNSVNIYFPSIDQRVTATVSSVSQAINPINRTIGIEVRLPNKSDLLKANMSGEIEINDLKNDKAITIPQELIQNDGSSEYVFVLVQEGGSYKASRRNVKTGQSWDNQTEILEGLKAGDMVITTGSSGVNDGDVVKLSAPKAL